MLVKKLGKKLKWVDNDNAPKGKSSVISPFLPSKSHGEISANIKGQSTKLFIDITNSATITQHFS